MEPVSCQASHPTLLSCSGLAVNWGPLCSLAGREVEKPCEAASAIPQPPVGTGLLPGFSPPGPSSPLLLVSSPLRGHIRRLPPGLGCQGPSELRPVPHVPSACPSGWRVTLTPAALHPKSVKFPSCKFPYHPCPPQQLITSKNCSL